MSLKTYQMARINRIRLEFKVYATSSVAVLNSCINRIRLEFKDPTSLFFIVKKKRINRIRLEFKA